MLAPKLVRYKPGNWWWLSSPWQNLYEKKANRVTWSQEMESWVILALNPAAFEFILTLNLSVRKSNKYSFSLRLNSIFYFQQQKNIDRNKPHSIFSLPVIKVNLKYMLESICVLYSFWCKTWGLGHKFYLFAL